jgi:hypothetical protein
MLQDLRGSYIRRERRSPRNSTFVSWLVALVFSACLLWLFASLKIDAIVTSEDVSMFYSP